MHTKKMIYWDQQKQRIRWTTRNDFAGIETFSFIEWATEAEFEVFLDIIFTRFGDDFVSTEKVMTSFQSFRSFIDKLKRIADFI